MVKRRLSLALALTLVLTLVLGGPALAQITTQVVYWWLLPGASNRDKACAVLDSTCADAGTVWTEFTVDPPAAEMLTFGATNTAFGIVRDHAEIMDTHLTVPGNTAISHISFCIDESEAAVLVASFTATCQESTPVIDWETASRIDPAGFNIWRGETDVAPEIQLNASMIPAHPDSTQGYRYYSFTDTTAEPGVTYYWLEDIDVNGATSLHGPISVTCSVPTAVTVSSLNATGSGRSATWLLPLIALVAGVAFAITLNRCAKTT